MDEKRLNEIDVILDECETTNELRRVMGSTGPLRELVAEIRRLRKTLEFYGDRRNYIREVFCHLDPGTPIPTRVIIDEDGGAKARTALGLD